MPSAALWSQDERSALTRKECSAFAECAACVRWAILWADRKKQALGLAEEIKQLLRARAIRREKGDALELGLVKIKKPYTRRGCLAGRYLWYCATDLGGRQLTPQMITDARNVQVCLAVTKSTAFKCFFQWITEAVFKLGWQGLSLLPSNQQHTALKIPNWYNTNWAVI